MSERPDIAVHLFEPSDGGLDRVAILLANGFRARGLRTELWLGRSEGSNARLIAPDLPVRMVATPPGKRSLALAAQLPALRHAVSHARPKLVLSAGNQSNLPVALACLGQPTAAVLKITNPVDRPGAKGVPLKLRRARFGRVSRLADLTLTLSEADACRHAEWEPGARFAFVHNPYVTRKMLALADRPARPSRQIVTVGRLAPQKDQATLLAALALLEEQDWRLTIVGDGPLHRELELQANRLGIASRITFAGFVDPLPHFAAADLFVLSSAWEGMPAVTLEALASGLPVVTTDCSPGLSELIERLPLPKPVPVRDPRALAVAIGQGLSSTYDGRRLSEAAAGWEMEAAIDDHLRLLRPFL